MLGLSKMKKLADGARNVKPMSREPVKTQFTGNERGIVEDFCRSQYTRDLSSDRMRSLLALSSLLGKPLDDSNGHLLKDADIVADLHFLVGGGTVKSGNDWQLKCLGLAEVKPGVFVVGLNRIFYENKSLEIILSPD